MAYQPAMETTATDILILGSGGAGLFAALHAYDANPRVDPYYCQGVTGQIRLYTHGARGLQRRPASPGFARAALPGHD